MASENHKTTHKDNIQKIADPSAILQNYTRGISTKHQNTGFLQQKLGQGLVSPAGKPPGLWTRVLGPYRDFQTTP